MVKITPEYVESLRKSYERLTIDELRLKIGELNGEHRDLLTQYFEFAAQSQELNRAIKLKMLTEALPKADVVSGTVKVINGELSLPEMDAAIVKLQAAKPKQVVIDKESLKIFVVL